MVDLIKELNELDCITCLTRDCSNKMRMCHPKRVKKTIKEWLSSFDTESADDCFTAIQELKKAVSKDDNR